MAEDQSAVRHTTRDWAQGRSLALVWGVPLAMFAVGFVWRSAVGPLWSISLLWIGIACTANALHCRRMHCSIMGPAFLVFGVLAAGNTFGFLDVSWSLIGNGAGLSVAVGYAPELFGWKYWPGKKGA